MTQTRTLLVTLVLPLATLSLAPASAQAPATPSAVAPPGSAAPPPPSGGGETCATAVAIAGFGTHFGDTTGAASDNVFACIIGTGRDLWYDWTASITGGTLITLCNPGTTSGDHSLTVFDNGPCPGSAIVCNNDTIPGVLDCPTVSLYAVAGTVYRIRIMNPPALPGPYEMSISPQFVTFCEPGSAGVVSCPCGNPPSSNGRGCNNFGGTTGGARLAGDGWASVAVDQLYLVATQENANAFNVVFTGSTLTAPSGVVHGAGVRCVTGLKRRYTGSASGGMLTKPGPSDQGVNNRSTALGIPITPGDTRYYFNVYRDPAAAGPCGNSASTVNLTNAVRVVWAP
jgi:hypothetical protein